MRFGEVRPLLSEGARIVVYDACTHVILAIYPKSSEVLGTYDGWHVCSYEGGYGVEKIYISEEWPFVVY